jgi:hypothetical protein
MADQDERHLSGPLLVGMLTLPTMFCWLFLRRGYSRSLRFSAFFYTIALTVAGLIAGHP